MNPFKRTKFKTFLLGLFQVVEALAGSNHSLSIEGSNQCYKGSNQSESMDDWDYRGNLTNNYSIDETIAKMVKERQPNDMLNNSGIYQNRIEEIPFEAPGGKFLLNEIEKFYNGRNLKPTQYQPTSTFPQYK